MHFRKEQLYRYRRYLAMSRGFLTPKKLINAVKIEYKLFKSDPHLENIYPYNIFIDLNNSCNLNCPLCFMGKGDIIPRENKMTFLNYKKIMDPLFPYLFQIFLQNNAEPFLNSDVYKIISLNKENKVATIASSNLSLNIDSDAIVESGLNYLCVSADGITQETYSKYRVNGKLEKVLLNLQKIIEAKRKIKSKTPFIEWQVLVSKHNHSEMAAIRKKAYAMGVDFVRFSNLNFYPFFDAEQRKAAQQEWLPVAPEFRAFEDRGENLLENGRKKCFWLWRTVVVNCDGGVLPCCLYDTNEWGNLFKEPFEQIWNNNLYVRARNSMNIENQREKIICDRCFAPFLRP